MPLYRLNLFSARLFLLASEEKPGIPHGKDNMRLNRDVIIRVLDYTKVVPYTPTTCY